MNAPERMRPEDLVAAARKTSVKAKDGLNDSEQARYVLALRSGLSWESAVQDMEAQGVIVKPESLAGWRAELERRAAIPDNRPRMPPPAPPLPAQRPIHLMGRDDLAREVTRLRAEVAELKQKAR